MKKTLIAAIAMVALSLPANAGGLTEANPPWMEPPVYVPPGAVFSWGGPYAGASVGQSTHRRTYTREWDEIVNYREEKPWEREVTDTKEVPWEREVIDREEIPWEKHAYECTRGTGSHTGRKCDITGLTHAPEFGLLDFRNNPWNGNGKNKDWRYTNGYDGLWMGASEAFAFTLPSFIAPKNRPSSWGQIGYEYLSGVDVIETTRIETGVDIVEFTRIETGVDVHEWSETITHTEEYTVTETDTTYGGFVGYRHQFQKMPLVVGLEANFMTTSGNGDFAQLGAQVGFAAGRVLPYAEVGIDHYAGGVDIALGQTGNVLVGFRTWESHDGNDSGQMVRVGWKF